MNKHDALAALALIDGIRREFLKLDARADLSKRMTEDTSAQWDALLWAMQVTISDLERLAKKECEKWHEKSLSAPVKA